jgi:hypothetical protein
MQATLISQSAAGSNSKTMIWAGRILSALAVLFLILDGVVKVVSLPPAIDASVSLGLPANLVPRLGVLLLVCVAVYVVPRTAVLGALLITGYLGGAIAVHARNGSELFSLVFPLILAAMVWGGLVLRDKEVRSLLLRL